MSEPLDLDRLETQHKPCGTYHQSANGEQCCEAGDGIWPCDIGTLIDRCRELERALGSAHERLYENDLCLCDSDDSLQTVALCDAARLLESAALANPREKYLSQWVVTKPNDPDFDDWLMLRLAAAEKRVRQLEGLEADGRDALYVLNGKLGEERAENKKLQARVRQLEAALERAQDAVNAVMAGKQYDLLTLEADIERVLRPHTPKARRAALTPATEEPSDWLEQAMAEARPALEEIAKARREVWKCRCPEFCPLHTQLGATEEPSGAREREGTG